MAKFILIDHSLIGVEGHHYEYDINILQAAGEAGYSPVIATHKSFRRPADMPAHWQVLPIFPHTSYSKYTVFSGLGERALDFRKPLAKAWSERPHKWRWLSAGLDWRSFLLDFKYARRRQHRIRRFSAKCRKLFREVDIQPDDILFVPTSTEFDFECLVNFLESSRASQRTPWHVQFHFNYLEGREPTFVDQRPRFAAMQNYFQQLLARVPDHQLHLYTTSAPLAEQYAMLGVGNFHMLPYPVSIHLTPQPRTGPHQQLRVTCAGCIRPEKGHQHLNGLVQTLWRDYFSTGRLQLVMQTDQTNPQNMIPWASYARARTKDAAIEFVRFPLARPDYLQLIHRTHIGLFTYDSERYYTRCSGVLVEMLSAGIPVIVPAACWLSEQIAEPIFEHQAKMAAELPHVASYAGRDLQWQLSDGSPLHSTKDLAAGGSGVGITTEIPITRPATQLMAQINTNSWQAGCFGRMICEQLDANGQWIDRNVAIASRRAHPSKPVSTVMLHIAPATARLRVTFENAFHHLPLPLKNLQLILLDSSSRAGGCPTGSVGLIAADPGEVSVLLREMLEQYSHYEATARQFADGWNHKHAPSQTIVQLRQRAAGSDSEVTQRRAA